MAIKLLLIEDVEDLGKSGDIVSVKSGFANNYLLPKKLGIRPNKQVVKLQARLQEERAKRAVEDRREAEELAAKLANVTLTTIVKVDQEGHMFGSVSALDIIKLLLDAEGIELTRKAVRLVHPIKATGVYTISLRLKEGVEASLQLKIVPDTAKAEEVPAA